MKAISKKLLSLLIVLAMVLSMTPVITLPAAAATDPLATWNTAEYSGKFIGATENVTTDGCPFCNATGTVTWNVIGDGATSTTTITLSSGQHAYFKDDTTFKNMTSASTSDTGMCVYFNNKNISVETNIAIIRNGYCYIGEGLKSDGTVGTATVTRTSTGSLFSNSSARSKAEIYGGNYSASTIYKPNSTYTPTGGRIPLTIHAGTFTGAIDVLGNGTFAINGGTINGNVNIQSGATLALSGGTLNGGVTVASGATITLSGAPTISAPGLTLGTDVYADVTNLATTSGAIAVNGELGDKIATGGDATKAGYFTVLTNGAADDTLEVTDDGSGNLTITEKQEEVQLPEWSSDIPTRIDQWLGVYADDFTAASAAATKENVETAICPICGKEDITWVYRYSTNALNVGTDAEMAHYYLYSDVERNTQDTVGSDQQYPVCVYLNNKTYSTTGVFRVKNTLNIFDDPNVGGGQVLGAAGTTNLGAGYVDWPLFRLMGDAPKLNLYYGEYVSAQPHVSGTNDDGTALISAEVAAVQAYIYKATLQNTGYGEVLQSTASGTVEFESCELKGGSGYVDGEGVTYGGNIYMTDGTVTLKNTTVTGGTATNGSVYVGGGTLKLAGTTSIATNGLTLGTDVYADVTDLATTSGAIVVNGVKDQVIATNGDETKAGYFTVSGEDGLTVAVNDSNELYIKEPEAVDPGPAYEADDTTLEKIDKFTAYYADAFSGTDDVETANCPICGATNVTWEARSGSGAGAGFAITTEAKHFYLTETCGRTTQDMLGTEHAATGCIYLNNYTSTTYGRFLIKDTLNIFDDNQTAGGGITKIVNTYATAETPSKTGYLSMPMLAVTTGELNIYGGHFEVQQPVIAGFNVNGTPVIGASSSNSRVNIYGGTFANTGAGTVIEQSNGVVTMTGGTLQGGSGYVETATVEEVTTATGNLLGGNVYVTGGTFVLNGGTIENGTATSGGNVYVAAEGTFTLTTGNITGGKANDDDEITTGGGNVFNGGTFAMTSGTISGGTATNDGGNVFNYRATGKSCTLSGGNITGGKATNGGNLYGRMATTLSGVTISGGTATNGGNLYTINSRITMSAGSVTGGNATNGGNVYVARGGSGAPAQLRLSGGTVSGGVATGNGGNVYVRDNSYSSLDLRGGTISDGEAAIGGNVYVTGAGTLEMTSGNITGGKAPDAKGSSVYASGKAELSGGTIHGTNDVTDSALIVTGSSSLVNLSGDVTITADNGKAIRVISSGTLNIEPTWTGTAYAMIVRVNGWAMGAKILNTTTDVMDYVQCGTYDADGNWTACGEGNYFSGSLYQYTGNGEKLFALADGSLQVAGSAYVSGTDVTWCREATAIEQALAAASYDYLWLSGEVALNGESIIVDLSGSKDVVLSGNGTVTGIDLANTDYKTNSDPLDIDLLSTDTITVNSQYTFGGNRYIALNNGSYSFHCLDLKLTSISLRPNKDDLNGLYYKSTITCDTTLADAVEAYGVVLSKSDMPGDNFVTEVDANDRLVNGWTEVTDALGISETKTSVTVNSAIMQGIVKEATTATNATRGKTKVYANGYLAIANGEGELEYIMSNDTSEVIGCSLFDVLNAINTKWDNYANVHDNIGGFYKYWAERGLSAWDSELGSIAAHAATLQ